MFIKDMISKDHLQFLLRHSLITVLAFALISFMAAIALNVSFLNPLSKAISDFNFTDVYYQILQESGDNEYNDDIVLVDLTPLQNRQEIATALQQIEEQHPKVIGVDCVFEGLKEDTLGDIMISNVAAEYQNGSSPFFLCRAFGGGAGLYQHAIFALWQHGTTGKSRPKIQR